MKRAAIALALVLMFTSFSTIFISIVGGDGEMTYPQQETFEVPERTDDGFFTENKGQWNDEILFVGETSFGQIGLGKGCVFFNMQEIVETDKVQPGFERMDPFEKIPHEVKVNGHVVKYTFDNSNNIVPVGVGPKNNVNNYFYGNDPDKWVRGASNFEFVIYPGLYDDIDLKYYFSEKGPKYDLVLNPGSDPEDIHVRVDGHDSLTINDGNLDIIANDILLLKDQDLVSYYDVDDKPIPSTFDLIDKNTFKYNLENYDKDERVVIDPLIFSTFLGGANAEFAHDLITTLNDDIIIVGTVQSTDFPTTPGAFNRTHAGVYDIFVTKLNHNGSALVFSTFIGGSQLENLYNFELDNNGNIYLTGTTQSLDFPTTDGAWDEVYGGGTQDAFLLKLNNDGSDLDYSTYVGGSGDEDSYGGLWASSDGEVVITGTTSSSDFTTTAGSYDPSFNGNTDAYIVKFLNNGSCEFSSFIGGSDFETVWAHNEGLYVNSNGSIYVVGTSNSIDFPTTTGVFQDEIGGSTDIVYFKMKSDGSDLIFSTYIGGGSSDDLNDYYWDPNENLILAGMTDSTDFPTTSGAYNAVFNGGTQDSFILKMNNDASSLHFSTFLGGSDWDYPLFTNPGHEEDIVVTGYTRSLDFPVTPGVHDRDPTKDEIYISILSRNGSSLIASSFFGGNEYDQLSHVHVQDSMIYFVGISNSTDLNTTSNAYDEDHNGLYDTYIAIIGEDLKNLEYFSYLGGVGNELSNGHVTESGDLIIFSSTQSDDFPTTPGSYDPSFNAGRDVYITKIDGGIFNEPGFVNSVKSYSDDEYSILRSSFDIDDEVFIELHGLDSNPTKRDFASVNVSFRWSPVRMKTIRLRETGINTGVYQGKFTIPLSTIYCDTITISSRTDSSKNSQLFIEPPYRPTSISDVEVYIDSGMITNPEYFDHGETVYIKVTGNDAHPSMKNLALVNVTSQKDSNLRYLLTLLETDTNSGIYTGSFEVSYHLDYFDNITVYSVRNEAITDKFMVHTPVQIRPFEDVGTVEEDEEYRVGYWNFGHAQAEWTLDPKPPWLNWNQTSSELFGTPNNTHVGLWNVTLTLDDLKGHVDSHEFQITVINKPPSIMVDLVTQIIEGEDYYCDFDSSDDGQGEIEWSFIGSAPWLTIDQDTGVLSGRPLMDDVGSFSISVIVKDGNGGIGSLDFEIVIIATKKPPLIESVDIISGKQGENYYRDYKVYDPDTDEYDLVWTLETNANFLEIDEKYGILQGTPGKYDVGVFWVIVTVTDPDGLSDNHSFNLDIENINDKPEWEVVPEDTSIRHGKWYHFDVNATDPDPEGFIEYTISSEPETNITIDSDLGELSWYACIRCFATNIFDLEVTIRVSDGELQNIHTFHIEVIPTLSPTSTITGPGNGEKMASDNTVIEWEGTDPENEHITYDIYIHESQAYVTGLREEAIYLSDYDGTSLNVGTLDPGILYYWMVMPFDGGTFGTCSSGVLSFKINWKPTVDVIQPQEAKTGKEFSLKIPGSDQDQEDTGNLIFTLNGAPEGMIIKEDTGMIRWTPKDDQKGDHVISVMVTDGVETTSASFDLEVVQGDEEGFPLFIIIIIVVVLLLIILAVLAFLFLRKKEDKEEEVDEESEELAHIIEDHQKEMQWEKEHYHHHEKSPSVIASSAMMAHAHDHDKHDELGYKDLYGSEPPEVEGGEGKIEEPKESLVGPEEQMEPPVEEEEEHYLEDLISHMTKTTSNIETYGQELKSVKQELKPVEDPYDHFGENEEDIEK
jgi:hypothetical protein